MNLMIKSLMELIGKASLQVDSEKVMLINMILRRLRGLMVFTVKRNLF